MQGADIFGEHYGQEVTDEKGIYDSYIKKEGLAHFYLGRYHILVGSVMIDGFVFQALTAAEATTAKWRSAHESARSQAAARAELMLADCEWKMRELEKRARDAEGKNKQVSAPGSCFSRYHHHYQHPLL